MMQAPGAPEAAGSEANPPSLTHLEPYARLVQLVARGFYADIGFKGEEFTTCAEDPGLAVVILDKLTRCLWVEEEELARSLKLSKRSCLAILRYFESEGFLKRKTKEIPRAPGPANADTSISYWCLDYPKICAIIEFKLKAMKEKVKSQLRGKEAVQAYICQNCKRRYTSFDVMYLPSSDHCFHCENCSGQVEEIDEESSEAAGDGKKRRTALVDLLQRMEDQLAPLVAQLALIEKLPVAEFSYLDEQETVHNEVSSSSGQGDRFLEETMAEASPRLRRKREADTNLEELKILPEWMIKEGMILKDSAASHERDFQDAYVKAYQEALNNTQLEKGC